MTDSIIYYPKNGQELLETKSLLGHLESELEVGEYITSFASTGPKSYTYQTNLNKEIIYVKEFSKIKTKTVNLNNYILYEMVESLHNKEYKIIQSGMLVQKDLNMKIYKIFK